MEFEQRQIINGSLMPKFIGKKVSMFVHLNGESTGLMVNAKTSDNQNIRVKLPELLETDPPDWVEVIGTPIDRESIRANEVIILPKGDQPFDTESHNMMVQIFQNCSDFYKFE